MADFDPPREHEHAVLGREESSWQVRYPAVEERPGTIVAEL